MPESDFMKNFKVATFEFSAGHSKEGESGAPALDQAPKPHFWENILQIKHLQLQALEMERLGKGKRARKKVCNHLLLRRYLLRKCCHWKSV